MADGLNDARAMRVAEIMTDFRNLQHYIAQIRISPTAEEYYLEGYALIRQCVAEGRSILAVPFSASSVPPSGNPEAEKAQLRSVILDASVRRFKSQRTYLRATAAMRWINARNAVLSGPRSHGRQAQLQAVDQSLRVELASITDERVEYALRAQDAAQGKWLAEDPSLATIQQMIRR
ncbi:hypothetical protein H2201_005250 [Coniosporium apollinis]|uniref:Uncharacterized protein n=1 Tax=Coniosporium apollinis TaxID=61459 RepID=A0ABQ9NQA6_9PEZI|nr:hypothetical protein H2201_005250 [Coniosporium apollinis]